MKKHKKTLESIIKFLDHHHILGCLLFFVSILIFTAIILYAFQADSLIAFHNFYPNNCPVPQVPRNETCSTQWVIQKNQKGCREFICRK